ncbi:nitroreductase family deazaflavin-dependent oxidoreductase [Nocardia sp. 2]|uniref:Nitroreductase family deazaflavin-dependent oxidoreductase n=1 Tax=Nocardia acididurans TaxID=2802282 RepID=A0ABS1MC83_9NOCA|nr:nitroreductase family deazaflavin-dependent oxidoreductase [Nocardia acididurans]MBL1078256.1 nitroreductase family deazaflavin-dependent oxidoreductase [Nocardia acididurans]
MSQNRKRGALSLWWQRTMNARTTTRIRRKGGQFWGMDMLVLHTVGRRTGQERETPLSWFADGDDWLIVASGGGSGYPDWYRNLEAHPDRTAVELHGQQPVAVTPTTLGGSEREQAWKQIITAQPRYQKYQSKARREYPVVRLATH